MNSNSVGVDLWWADYRDFADGHVAQLSALLDPEEERSRARFRFDRDCRSYAISHGLLRTILSTYCDCPPSDWRYQVGSHGKPTVASPAEHRGLHFNLSHTRGAMLVGVSRAAELGVDIEFIGRESACEDLADRYFSASEARGLRELPPERRRERFFELWTLKEAYIKARGLGLAIPLDAFSFRRRDVPSARSWSIAFAPQLSDEPAAWRFAERRIEQDFQAAVAVHAGEIEDVAFMWRRLRPGSAADAVTVDRY